MEILIKAAQLILSLSILVIFHEFGHFIFAKLFKARVEKFYLFFNPWFELFKVKKGETEYGIGWIPLGGYVKISGMIDESMDKEQMKQPPKPHEFRSKPAWQRFFIMVGGVLVNFLLAMFIYIMVLYSWGKEYLPTANATYGVYCDSLALASGLQHGDMVLGLDGKEIENFNQIRRELLLNDVNSIEIERNGNKMSIPLPENTVAELIKSGGFFIEPAFPFFIQDFTENSNAKVAGIKKEDKIIGINNQKLRFFAEFIPVFAKHKGEEVILLVERNGQLIDIPTKVSDEGKIGVMAKSAGLFEYKTIKYNIFAAIPEGIAMGYNELKDYLKQLKLIFNPDTGAYKSVGSFITIGSIFPDTWDWYRFWMLTALLSIMLGVINILPIPALDGGHVMFLIYEMAVGRKPSDKFMEYAQLTGMVLLLLLMVLAIGNDVFRHIIN